MVRRRRRYNRQSNRPTGPIAEFIEGLTVGVAIVGFELLLFVFTEFNKVAQTIIPQSSFSSSYLSFTTLLLSGAGFLHYFLLGLFDSEAASVGFLFGDVLTLILLSPILWHISPSIVIGLVIGFFIVLCCLFFRISLKGNRPRDNDWYY